MKTQELINQIAIIEKISNDNHDHYLSSVTFAHNPVEILKNKDISRIKYNAAPDGYQQQIDTLTRIKQETIKQKFYEENIADFVPVKVGDGAFTEESLYYKSYQTADDFEEGIIDQGHQARKSTSQPLFDAVKLKNYFWARKIDYSLIQAQQAAANMQGAISLIQAKEAANLKSWQLGLQKSALSTGISSLVGVNGLLSLTAQQVSVDLAIIPKAIRDMTSTEMNALIATLLADYDANTNNTALPNCFVIPRKDFLGLASEVSEGFPIKKKLESLQESFVMLTGNPNFKIKPLAYAEKEKNNIVGNVNRYVLYKNDAETLEMNIPIQYTSTTFNSSDNFTFSNVSYGQFSGVIAKRPQEIKYYDNSVNL